MDILNTGFSKGIVEIVELPGHMREPLYNAMANYPDDLDSFLRLYGTGRVKKGNLVFNFPREQYAKLDRGETIEAINASWFTLSAAAYTNPATQIVAGETQRVGTTTRGPGANPKHSVFRFILDLGQFTGTWQTGLLIGGDGATSTPGTGKIVAAVNNIKDDTGTALSRDGSTIHSVTWKLKHLDSSEI